MNIFKLGFVTSQMGPSQVCYDIIKSSNEYLASQDDVDISLYWISDGPRVIEPRFACFPLIETFAFPGHTVCTNLHTLSRVLSYPGPNRSKYIYLMDYNLDYNKIPPQGRSWEQLNGLYNHPKVKVIVRSESHADILSSTLLNYRPNIVSDCNIGKLKEFILE